MAVVSETIGGGRGTLRSPGTAVYILLMLILKGVRL